MRHNRWLTIVALIAIVALYAVAAACKSGDDDDATTTPTTAPSRTTTPEATNGGIVPPSLRPSGTGSLANTVAASDRTVEILDSGFTALRGGIQGGFIAHNKSTTEAVEIGFIVNDVSGAAFSGAYGTLVLMPDETHGVAFGAQYSTDSVAGIDIELNDASARWKAIDSTDHLATSITTTETQSVTGTVANPFSVATGPLWMHVITYNAAGDIIGGNTQGIGSVPANGSGNFTAQVPFVGDDYANNARVEAYAEFQNQLPSALVE